MRKYKIEYTLLAKSIPEFDKRDGKLYTCSLGYSPQLGLIRIYPLPVKGMVKWGIYEVEVEKNKRDSRRESWKLSSYARHENWVNFDKDFKFLGKANNTYKTKITKLLQSIIYPSISELNKDRKSIGVLLVDKINPHWDKNDRYINTCQVGMFDDVDLADFTKYTKETKEKQARVIFRDGDGSHNLQLNEWQYTEYQRKFGATKDAFRFINTTGKNLILIGNMLQYQNSWMVLGVFKSLPQPATLF
jgi:hypothetical protein